MLGDPHLRDRGYFEPADHHPKTGLGRREYLSRGWRMSGNDVHIRKPAPMLGEDNAHILSDLLGLTEPQISQLEEAEAIGQTLAGARTPASVPLDRQVELGWTVDYDTEYRSRPSSGA